MPGRAAGSAAVALTMLLAASAAGNRGMLQVTFDDPLAALADPATVIAITVCDASGGVALFGGCADGVRTQTRRLTTASFQGLAAGSPATLAFGMWAAPVSLNVTAIAGPTAGSGADAMDQLTIDQPNDFTAAAVGVYSGTASFAAIPGYQAPPDLPTVDPADFVGANVKQEFVAAANGFLYAVGMVVTVPDGTAGVVLNVQARATVDGSGQPVTGTATLTQTESGTEVQVLLDTPLPVTSGDSYIVGVYATRLDGDTLAAAQLGLLTPAPPISTDVEDCTQDWYPDPGLETACPTGKQLALAPYIRSVAGCVELCVVASATADRRPECALGCSAQTPPYTDSECAAQACLDHADTPYLAAPGLVPASRPARCDQPDYRGAIETGCSLGNNSAGTDSCPIAALNAILHPLRLEVTDAPGSADGSPGTTPGLGIGCQLGTPANQGVESLTASYFCSRGGWHPLPAASVVPDCPLLCHVYGVDNPLSLAAHLTALFESDYSGASRYTIPHPTDTASGSRPELPLADIVVAGTRVYRECNAPWLGSMFFECTGGGAGWDEVKVGSSTAANCSFPTQNPTPSATTGSPTPDPSRSPTPSPTSRPSDSPTPAPTRSPTPAPTRSLTIVFPGAVEQLSTADQATLKDTIEARMDAVAGLGAGRVQRVDLQTGSIIASVIFDATVTAAEVVACSNAVATAPVTATFADGSTLASTSPNQVEQVAAGAGRAVVNSDEDDGDGAGLVVVIVLIVVMVVAIGYVLVLQQRRSSEIERKAVPLAQQRQLKAPLSKPDQPPGAIELQMLNRATSPADAEYMGADAFETKSPTPGGAAAQPKLKLGGMSVHGQSGTDNTGTKIIAGMSVHGQSGTDNTGTKIIAGMSVRGQSGTDNTGTKNIVGMGGHTRTETVKPRTVTPAEAKTAINLRLDGFYRQGDDNLPDRTGESQRRLGEAVKATPGTGTNAASKTDDTLPQETSHLGIIGDLDELDAELGEPTAPMNESIMPVDRNSMLLQPEELKVDGPNSVRLASVKRENPLYAAQVVTNEQKW